MTPKLTERQKDLLRRLTQEMRKRGSDEYIAIWMMGSGSAIIVGSQSTNFDIDPGALSALVDARMLTTQKLPRGGLYCTLTGDAYAAVDSDFAPDPPPLPNILIDQRYQNVGIQYNAGRDINITAVQDKTEFVQKLEQLREEIGRAAQENIIDAELAVDADTQIRKAIIEAKMS